MLTKICVLGGSGLIGSSILLEKYSSIEFCCTYQNNKPNNNYPNLKINIPEDFQKLEEFINFQKPNIIINTISNSNPDFCESNQKNTYDVNIEFVKKIFRISEKNNIKLIHFSSDYVFDGKKKKYSEMDKPNPINYYGYSKYMSEKIVLQNSHNAVIRTSLVYGKNLNARFFNFVIDNLKSKNEIDVYDDIFFSPTLVNDIVKSMFIITKKSLNGIFHISGTNCINKYEFAKKIARIFDLDGTLIKKSSIKKLKSNMNYPTRTCLDSSSTSQEFKQKFHSIDSGLMLIKNSI